MHTDPVADMFTRVRNAVSARKKAVTIPASNLKKGLTRVMHEQKYIKKYAFVDDDKQGEIKILLKYDDDNKNAIEGIKKVSVPGRREYTSVKDMPKVLNGMGVCFISTSKGIMTDREAKKVNIGGEVIGMIW